MRRNAFLFLVLALAAGSLAAMMAARLLEPPAVAAEEGGRLATQPVAVAARDMNVGTLLTAADVRLVDWPAGLLPEGYSNSAADLVGRGLLTPVSLNEPLLAAKLASPESGGGMRIMIPAGMRAMSVRVDDIVGVSGFVLPGTRVDVLVTVERAAGEERPATRLVLQNVEVVSAGTSIERNPEGEPQQVSVVTLLVGPVDAEKLALAHSAGRLQLALRNPLDMDSVSTPGLDARELIRGPARPVVRVSGVRPTAPSRLQMEIFRGPERTTSTVDTIP